MFDAYALIAQLRRGDEAALVQAYRVTFGGELGRLVLADIAQTGGVGMKYGGASDLYSVGYQQGGHDLALDVISRAGFDQASAISMVMTGRLEGSLDERSANPDAGTGLDADTDDPDF